MIDFLRHSISHVFVDELSDLVVLDEMQAHHLVNVLRVKPGYKISAASEGFVRSYSVESIGGKTVRLEPLGEAVEVVEKEVNLAVSLFKIDRLEWGISKAVETGARTITIAPSSRSNLSIDRKKQQKVETRLNALAYSAASQSRRSHLPRVSLAQSLVEQVSSASGKVLICEPGGNKGIVDTPSTLVIGPEGGFSDEELELFDTFAERIELSNYILRAETAMAIACALAG